MVPNLPVVSGVSIDSLREEYKVCWEKVMDGFTYDTSLPNIELRYGPYFTFAGALQKREHMDSSDKIYHDIVMSAACIEVMYAVFGVIEVYLGCNNYGNLRFVERSIRMEDNRKKLSCNIPEYVSLTENLSQDKRVCVYALILIERAITTLYDIVKRNRKYVSYYIELRNSKCCDVKLQGYVEYSLSAIDEFMNLLWQTDTFRERLAELWDDIKRYPGGGFLMSRYNFGEAVFNYSGTVKNGDYYFKDSVRMDINEALYNINGYIYAYRLQLLIDAGECKDLETSIKTFFYNGPEFLVKSINLKITPLFYRWRLLLFKLFSSKKKVKVASNMLDQCRGGGIKKLISGFKSKDLKYKSFGDVSTKDRNFLYHVVEQLCKVAPNAASTYISDPSEARYLFWKRIFWILFFLSPVIEFFILFF